MTKIIRTWKDNQGWICPECDILNKNSTLCESCGYQRNYFRKSLNLYKIQGIWRTAYEWSYILNRTTSTIYDIAEERLHKRQV